MSDSTIIIAALVTACVAVYVFATMFLGFLVGTLFRDAGLCDDEINWRQIKLGMERRIAAFDPKDCTGPLKGMVTKYREEGK